MARLLATAYRMLIDGLHEGLRREGWADVRPAFGFVLLAARDAPTTSTALAALMGTTKQAASKLIDAMEEAGLVRRSVSATDARSKTVDLDARGRELLAVVERIYIELEARWASVVGATAMERMRYDLVAIVASAHDGVLPPVRPTW
ncbi:MAG: MarR family transcriptional regulator [Ilumatobacteraceae bacterium]